MISQMFMTVYFYGAYIWFLVGFLVIAIPAIMEISKMVLIKNNLNH